MNKLWFDHESEKKRDDIKNSFKGKHSIPLDRQLKEKVNQKLKEYKMICKSQRTMFWNFAIVR